MAHPLITFPNQSADFIVWREYVKGVQIGTYTGYTFTVQTNPFVVRLDPPGPGFQELRFTFNSAFLAVQSGGFRLADTVDKIESRTNLAPLFVPIAGTVNYALPADKKCHYIALQSLSSSKIFRKNLTPLPSSWWVQTNPNCPEILT